MASPTPRLALVRPSTSDGFSTTQHAANLTLLDAFPGVYVTTVAAPPAGWGVAHTGMLMLQTDSVPAGLLWRWTGTEFVRVMPVGLLGTSDITADFSTPNTAAQTAITCNATVPVTNAGSTAKRVRVSASFYSLDNGTTTTLGACEVSLWRDAVLLKTFLWRGRPYDSTDPLDSGNGGTIEAFDNPAAGARVYTLKVNSISAVGGTTTLRASPTTPAQLAVVEVGL